MSESEKTKYWDVLSPRFQRFYNFALDIKDSNKDVITDLFEYRVATKGLLLNSTLKITESILTSGNQKLIDEYSEWLDQKDQLAGLYVYSKEELNDQGINIDSLEAENNALEKKLSQNSEDFASFFFANRIKFDALQNQLKGDEALLEIIRVRHYDRTLTDSCVYLFLTATKDKPTPQLTLLANGPAMENIFSKNYQQSIKRKKADELSWVNYWAALDKVVSGKKRIYVSLDGVYNQINLGTLKKPGADFLVKEYDLVLVGNPKDILTEKKEKITISKKAALIGYPDYGSEMIPELPGTKTEVDSINKVLLSSDYKVDEYLQRDATEANLKRAKKISVLHIATHGYFLPDASKTFWPIGVHLDNAKENVLLRSGLLLTGASVADKSAAGFDNNNNGVITSYEAMNLDLKGTDLVVLSACETGIGEIKAGEGVYGLQRAFLMAGAETLIMSLWKVDDAATQQLMRNFYSNWIKNSDKQMAFRLAQLQLMAKYKDPFYWGAFVMIGK